MEYVYKYVTFDGKIVYIGRTDNIERRVNEHKKDKLKNFTGNIYYSIHRHKTASKAYEYFLINKYKPLYNSALIDLDKIDITEPSWKLYTTIGENNNKNKYKCSCWLNKDTNQIMYKIHFS